MKILPVLTLIAFALWWGGFTFYAAWVVPTAHAVLGNHVLAGMITQQVSKVLNVLTAVFIILATAQFLLGKKERSYVISLIIITLGLIALFFLHAQIDKFIVVETQSLTDSQAFYSYHRLYLIISALMWLSGLVWLFSFFKKSKNTEGVTF